LGPLPSLLGRDGVVSVPDIYSAGEIAELNAAMDPFFAKKSAEARSYLWPDDMVELGILRKVLSPGMRNVLFSIMPDPVIYHLLSSEIAARNRQPHVFSEKPGGWHRDPDCGYFAYDPTHVSITVYLTEVGPENGMFEMVPEPPDRPIHSESKVVSITGHAGRSFVWHRSFYHRASPNCSPRRRRIIKISIQRNAFLSSHLKAWFFKRTLAELSNGDAEMDLLLGRHQGKTAPLLVPATSVLPSPVTPTSSIGPLTSSSESSDRAKGTPTVPHVYRPRDPGDLGPVPQLLALDGIAMFPDIYSAIDLAEINALMNPYFGKTAGEARSYIWADDMLALGLFDKILSPAMRNVLFSILPDPVIYHLLASEIAGNNTKSHIFSEQPGGWHRDTDAGYFAHDPTHISVFVYLSKVGRHDGALEICPQLPERPPRPETPVISMTGNAGLSFAWHRSFFYREAPNSGPRRRRVIKISIQRNEFPSPPLRSPNFHRTVADIPTGDDELDTLLGRFQGKSSPILFPFKEVAPIRVRPTSTISQTTDLIK